MSIEKLDNRINRALSGWEIPSTKTKKAIWLSVLDAVETKRNKTVSFTKWRWVAAASLVAIVISFGIIYNAQVKVTSQANEKIAISLPDGSSVNLNSNSNASYNSITWYFNRSVSLSGEGFFNVKKGSTFSVNTSNGIIKVLGTSFNVLSTKDDFQVECYSGKVAVDNKASSVILTKGERIIFENKSALSKALATHSNTVPAWMEGKYSYSKSKLANVFKDISRNYNIELHASNKIKNMSFTGEWNSSMTLEEVLKIVCLPFNLEAKSLADQKYQVQTIR